MGLIENIVWGIFTVATIANRMIIINTSDQLVKYNQFYFLIISVITKMYTSHNNAKKEASDPAPPVKKNITVNINLIQVNFNQN